MEWTIPVIGGVALMAGSGLTIYVDRLERLRDPDSPRPVYYRYFSQAILALHQSPHWIFLLSCNVFGPCMYSTGVWQASLLENQCGGEVYEQCIQLGRILKIDTALTAVFVYLDGWIPLGRPVVTLVLHNIVAIGFFVTGGIYVYGTIRLARLLDEPKAVATTRIVLFGIMVASGLIIALVTSPSVEATGRILNHQYRGTAESKMEPDEIVKCRRFEATMSTAQMILGIGIGLAMITAVPEVVIYAEMMTDDGPDMSWAAIMFLTMLSLTMIQYLYRDRCYQWCQAEMLRFRAAKKNR